MSTFKIALLSLVLLTSLAFAKPDIAMEMMKDDIITSRRELIKANITLPKEKEDVFWAIYKEFEQKQKIIMDEKASIISSYTQAYYNLSDAAADDLAKRTFKVDAQYDKLELQVYKKLKKQISATVGVQFIQLMNRINLMVSVQIVNQLPLILTYEEPSHVTPTSQVVNKEAIKASHEAEVNAEEAATEAADGHM